MCGRLDDVPDVVDEIEGPGVVGGDDGMGGGVTETERCILAMWMDGRSACQKDAVDGLGTGAARLGGADTDATAAEVDATGASDLGVGLSPGLARAFRLSSLSFSFSFSLLFRARRVSLVSSTSLYMGTPLSTLVSTSRDGRGSKSPAKTDVAVRRLLVGGRVTDMSTAIGGDAGQGEGRAVERGRGTYRLLYSLTAARGGPNWISIT